MNTILNKVGILLIFIIGCKQPTKEVNVIAFSCMKCSGCVTTNLNYIRLQNLDKTFKIILDTNCYESQMKIINEIKYVQMPNSDIEKKYGRFGNFILLDSSGKKTEFMTDMNLNEVIK